MPGGDEKKEESAESKEEAAEQVSILADPDHLTGSEFSLFRIRSSWPDPNFPSSESDPIFFVPCSRFHSLGTVCQVGGLLITCKLTTYKSITAKL